MWHLLKYIFFNQKQDDRILIIKQDDDESQNPLEIRPFSPLKAGAVAGSILILTAALMVFITPIGNLYQSAQTHEIRTELQIMNQRTQSLSDSIKARDLKLAVLQRALLQRQENLFQSEFAVNQQGVGRPTEEAGAPASNNIAENSRSDSPENGTAYPPNLYQESLWNSYDEITERAMILSGFENEQSHTPFQYPYVPVDGIVSRGFDPDIAHFGIDFATAENTAFYAAEQGVVILAHWTLQYGYVMVVQHEGGKLSIYKHGASIYKKRGEYIFKGDLLGTVSDSGILSTGPHLHFELWDDGVPVNPAIFFPAGIR